jgi:hypothetical protein
VWGHALNNIGPLCNVLDQPLHVDRGGMPNQPEDRTLPTGPAADGAARVVLELLHPNAERRVAHDDR